VTKEDKAKIWLNAAKIYGVDVAAQRKALPSDALEKLKHVYNDQGGQRENAPTGGCGGLSEVSRNKRIFRALVQGRKLNFSPFARGGQGGPSDFV